MFRNNLRLFTKQLKEIEKFSDSIGFECVGRKAIMQKDDQLLTPDSLLEKTSACEENEQAINCMIKKHPALEKPLKDVKVGAMFTGSCRYIDQNFPGKMNASEIRHCKQASAMLKKAEEDAITAFQAYEKAEKNARPRR